MNKTFEQQVEEAASLSAKNERVSAEKCCSSCLDKFLEIGQHQHIHGFMLGTKEAEHLILADAENILVKALEKMARANQRTEVTTDYTMSRIDLEAFAKEALASWRARFPKGDV